MCRKGRTRFDYMAAVDHAAARGFGTAGDEGK